MAVDSHFGTTSAGYYGCCTTRPFQGTKVKIYLSAHADDFSRERSGLNSMNAFQCRSPVLGGQAPEPVNRGPSNTDPRYPITCIPWTPGLILQNSFLAAYARAMRCPILT
eukprot:61440-Rhodomonas_salina.3